MELQIKCNYLFQVAQKLSGQSIEELYTRKYPQIAYRWSIMKILRDDNYSYSQIGKVMQLHHSTIIHDLDTLDYLINQDSEVRLIYQQMTESSKYCPKVIVTTKDKIENWLNANNISSEIIKNLLETINAL